MGRLIPQYKQIIGILILFHCCFFIPATIPNSPATSSSISIITIDNIRYISLHDFADLFRARTFYSEKTKKMIIHLDNKVFKVTALNPFVIVDDQIYQLTVDAYYQDNDIFVPLKDFAVIIRQIFPDNITLNEKAGRLEISSSHYSNINQIEIQEKENGTLIKISVSRTFSASEVGLRERHGWLYVDIYGGSVDSVALAREIPYGIVSQIVPLQLSDQIAQISFKLRKSILEKQLIVDNPNEILISMRTKKDISSKITNELEEEKRKWLIDKIVIDPGHGGKDPGAIGRNGTYEKHVVLAIARKLKQLIEERTNIKVLMTREDDRFVGLDQRTEFANRNEAKLFISIHANSNPSSRVNGVSTYFLGPENTEEAREVALLENSVIKYEKDSKYADLTQENLILSTMAQNIYNTESEDMAAIVQHEISKRCRLIDRGVRQAGFYVLWGASMPNILVEVAFISNKYEEKKLRQSSFQEDVAEAIYESIKKFKKKYEWGI